MSSCLPAAHADVENRGAHHGDAQKSAQHPKQKATLIKNTANKLYMYMKTCEYFFGNTVV
jgi:hypothetical protein